MGTGVSVVQHNIENASSHSDSWRRICGKLRLELGESVFRSWLSPLEFVGVRGTQALISAPSRFIREWVINNYSDLLKRLWSAESGAVNSVDIFVRQKNETPAGNVAAFQPQTAEEIPTHEVIMQISQAREGFDDFGSPLDSRYTFDNFVVSKSNQLAFAAAKRVAETCGVSLGCNPLFFYGGVGLGKTHLMHSIAWHVRRSQPERKVVYLSAEKFMYLFIKSIRSGDVMNFKEQLRSADILMIDDIQFISGKESTQEEFFHTFNALVDQNRQLIISCDRSPGDLEGFEERARSRLGWGLVVDIDKSDPDLRAGILKSKAERLGIELPEDVVNFLAQRIVSNIRELEGALNRIAAYASLIGGKISVEQTQEILRDVLRTGERRLTIEDIQKKVADHFNVRISDLHSPRRSRSVARPRQIAMYLSKKLTSKSLPEIGRRFGGKDHTTVIHAVRKIEELCRHDNEFAAQVDFLSKSVNNH